MSTELQEVRLLLVDDEEEFLATMARALKRRNVQSVCATSGHDALQLVNLHEFDVAVVDVKMPGMDGVELFHHLKEALPDLPVIMLTAHGTVSQAFETAKEGIFDYIPKPCEVDDLAAKIQAAVLQRHLKRSPPGPEIEFFPAVRVLLVDDEVELLRSLTTVLSRRGLDVHTATSGEEALEFLDNVMIDVVVLDIKMPGMDGIETLRRIKSEITEAEVILLTGHPEVENAFVGMRLGAFGYIVKPPDIDELSDKIKEAFQTRRRKLEQKHQLWLRDIMERYPD